MNKDNIFIKLNEIFQEVFDDENIKVDAKTTSEDIEDWDSLEHINLVVSIEKEFKVKFDIKEVSEMKNVGEMVEVILNKLN